MLKTDSVEQISSLLSSFPNRFNEKEIIALLSGETIADAVTVSIPLTEHDVVLGLKLLRKDNMLVENGAGKLSLQKSLEFSVEEKTYDVVLLQKLKDWRSRAANEASVAIFRIASNVALEKIATKAPSTHALLTEYLDSDVVRKYGAQILRIIIDHKEYVREYQELQQSLERTNVASLPRVDLGNTVFVADLDEQQKIAVSVNVKKIACIAGAGSGKTTVLVRRIARYLSLDGVAGRNILAITFTRKAALEMKDRLLTLCGDKAKDVTLVTFNAFGEQLLRQASADDNEKIIILSDKQRLDLIMRALATSGIDRKTFAGMGSAALGEDYFETDDIIEELAQLSLETYDFLHAEVLGIEYLSQLSNISPDERSLLLTMRTLLEHYEKIKSVMKVRDYTDQLSGALALLRNNSSLLGALQKRYTHILVDEYQDINMEQQQLLQMLVQSHTSLFAVGDPRQSIYGFRGSRPDILLHVSKYFSDIVILDIQSNYRCGSLIVHAADEVIRPLGFVRSQIPKRKEDGRIVMLRSETSQDEALSIAKHIKTIRLAHNIPMSSIFVLARTNAQLDTLARVFSHHDIDFVKRDDERFQSPLPHQVVLSTVHAIKGLEAHTVFVCGLVGGKFPLVSSRVSLLEKIKQHAKYHAMEEELRLFYVALTRAREQVYLSWYGAPEQGLKSRSVFITPYFTKY